MKKDTAASKNQNGLRERAEQALHDRVPQELSNGDLSSLVHELQVHQIELEMQNEELKNAQMKLEESRDRYSDLYDFAPVGYFTFDKNGLILEVNLTGARMLGLERSILIKKPFYPYISSDSRESFFLHMRQVFGACARQTCELKLVNKEGVQFHSRLESLSAQNGKFSQCRTAVSDITESKRAEEALRKAHEELEEANKALKAEVTERRRSEEQLKESLKEKEVLLKEVYHRVKNNMQIISSLLMLQEDFSEDKKIIEMLKDSQNRISSMALIHERLYRSQNLSKINLKDYVNDLVSVLFQSYGVDESRVALNVDIENVSLGIDYAIHCGLIINELVSNSLKHAFPDDKNGEIKIFLRLTDENMIELLVGDNGIGIPEDMDPGKTQSLGLHLVKLLVENQLQGRITLNRDRGTEFLIKFRGLEKEPPRFI